jgi:hypothetical protein
VIPCANPANPPLLFLFLGALAPQGRQCLGQSKKHPASRQVFQRIMSARNGVDSARESSSGGALILPLLWGPAAIPQPDRS